jgi:RNA recognition motif-containing protein
MIKISGLELKITNKEIFDLFSEVGPMKKCNINYDSLGRSKGTAIIKYENFQDAK